MIRSALRSGRAFLLAGVILAAVPSAALGQTLALPPAADTVVSVGALTTYSEGDFGTGHTTRILYAPTIIQWFPTDRFELRLTVPYVWERGPNIVAMVGGGTTESRRRVTTGAGTSAKKIRTVDGLGDVLLELDYTLLERRRDRPEVSVWAEIKFPTADSTDGLGTGKFDETIGGSLRYRLVDRWIASLDLFYTFVGSPSGAHLSDAAGWSLGLTYRPRSDLALSAYFDGATTINGDQDNPLELRFQPEYAITNTIKVMGAVTTGLTNGAARWSTSLGIVFEF
jgi:hypothetical protein